MGTSGEPCVAVGLLQKHEVERASRTGKMIEWRESEEGPAVCREVSPQ